MSITNTIDPKELDAGLVVHVEPRALDAKANWRGRVWRDGILLATIVERTPEPCVTNVVQVIADVMGRDSADVAHSALQVQLGNAPAWARNMTGHKGNQKPTRHRP